jgi:hypothetical protein
MSEWFRDRFSITSTLLVAGSPIMDHGFFSASGEPPAALPSLPVLSSVPRGRIIRGAVIKLRMREESRRAIRPTLTSLVRLLVLLPASIAIFEVLPADGFSSYCTAGSQVEFSSLYSSARMMMGLSRPWVVPSGYTNSHMP